MDGKKFKAIYKKVDDKEAGFIEIPFDLSKVFWIMTANVMSDVMADAGIGTTLSIVRWGKLSNLKPLVIRFDMPFFVNRLPYEESDYLQFRWMIGVNKAF